MKKKSGIFLLLIGLFTATDIYVVGYVSITEFFMILASPFLFFRNLSRLRHDGFGPILLLLFLTMLGCIWASYSNHTPMGSFLRGFFTLYSMFSIVVCLHAVLRNQFDGLKWILLGNCFSMVLNIFIFQQGATHGAHGSTAFMSAEAMEATLEYSLFWVSRIKAFLYVPITGWYESVPKIYSLPVVVFVAVMGLFYSGGSGRSVALCAIVTCALLFVGAKGRRGLAALKKNMIWVLLVLGVLLAAFKVGYEKLAIGGYLGDAAYTKYMDQTKSGSGVLSMLMGGRVEFFSGIYACLLKPFTGYGPWAVDDDNVHGSFLAKYGNEDDFARNEALVRARVVTGGKALIPAHSHVICFWLWYGVFGLLLWVYVLGVMLKVFFRYLSVYPPWYGYLVCVLPTYVWNVFFSPFGTRVMSMLTIVVCILMRARATGRIQMLPRPY